MQPSSLAYFVNVLRKEFVEYCNKRLQALGLMEGQLYFILYVGKHPGCTQKELAQALRMDTGHTTRTLVKLKQNGFLEKEMHQKDKRSHIIRLTEKGKSAFRVSHELLTEWDAEVLQPLNSEERRQLMSLMRRFARGKEGMDCVRDNR